jgi:hypothetical protein
MQVKPFYSKVQKDVYHDNNQCTEGNSIEEKKPRERHWRPAEVRSLQAPLTKGQFPVRASRLAVDH